MSENNEVVGSGSPPQDPNGLADVAKLPWRKPEIVAYEPASSARGISYTPLDGISNLTT